ncbi:spermine synthase-like isoform X1 [Mizuhopecten yessoensis]|uniref:spermine synthase-like isoform X1 n=2 Tax=Mizuhopecten yessoensis TaxID=6573 RepID=UPI000B459567|nr:spermine synthase-like isoform X1 [Mizuhopecten yessoensis]
MSAKSIMLCFQLDETLTSDDDVLNKLKGVPEMCLSGPVIDVITRNYGKIQGHMTMAMSEDGSHVTVRMYPTGLVTVDVQRLMEGDSTPNTAEIAVVKNLEVKLRKYFGTQCKFSRSILGQICRGEVCPYFSSGEDLLFEYGPLKLVCEKESKWQNIKIYHSEKFGHMLCLDDDLMLGESDLIYTQTLLGVGRNDFRDKTVLILGGGDGGLLYELLKMEPRHVLMVEIDEEVIKACSTYMEVVCHDVLEKYEGPNHKIHIGDCMDVLKESMASGRKFDYVINDLTEFLVGTENSYIYDLETSSHSLEFSIKILNKGGKYLSRGNTVRAKSYTEKFEADIRALQLKFNRHEVDVPSFQEKYCLYEVWKP